MDDSAVISNLVCDATHYWDIRVGLCEVILVDFSDDVLICKDRKLTVHSIPISKMQLSECVLYKLTALNANRFSIKWSVPNEDSIKENQ